MTLNEALEILKSRFPGKTVSAEKRIVWQTYTIYTPPELRTIYWVSIHDVRGMPCEGCNGDTLAGTVDAASKKAGWVEPDEDDGDGIDLSEVPGVETDIDVQYGNK